MTAFAWFALAGYAALATALGALLLRALTAAEDRLLRDRLLHDWASCFLCGQIVITILTLSTGFLPWRLPAVVTASAAVVLLTGAWHLRRGLPRSSWRRALAAHGGLLLPLLVFPNLLLLVHHQPVYNWDARSIWMFHGKGIYFPGAVTAEFFTNPDFWWSNRDYPLQIPAQNAWSAQVLGGWTSATTRAFLLFDFAAYFRLGLSLLQERGQPWWLAIAALLLICSQQVPAWTCGEMYVSGQADLHYALPFVLALLALSAPPERRSVPLALLLLCYAAGTKTEALGYVVLLALAAAALLAIRHLRARRWPPLRQWLDRHRRELLLVAVLGALPWLLWSLFKLSHGLTGGLNLWQRLFTPGVLVDCLQERTGAVLSLIGAQIEVVGTQWAVLGWVVLAAASIATGLLGGCSWGLRRCEAFGLAGIAAMAALIFATYLLTPHDLQFHIETSAARLWLLPHLMVFLLCVFRVDLLVRAWRNPPHAGR